MSIILSSITTNTHDTKTRHDPIIPDTFGTVAKNVTWTMYDSTISVDRTNPTITGPINCNALTRMHSCIMTRMAKPNKLIHCLES